MIGISLLFPLLFDVINISLAFLMALLFPLLFDVITISLAFCGFHLAAMLLLASTEHPGGDSSPQQWSLSLSPTITSLPLSYLFITITSLSSSVIFKSSVSPTRSVMKVPVRVIQVQVVLSHLWE